MNDNINIEQLEIYNSYGGDIYGFCRFNKATETAIFGDSLDQNWAFITNKLQDIELIAKQLASYDYAKNTLTELKEKADTKTFKIFTDKIHFYDDFQKVKEILETIKSWTANETDTIFAGYDNGKEFLVDLNNDIEKISYCDFETLDKLNMKFAPSSIYQEISLSNGWGNEFLKLAEQYDMLHAKIKKQADNDNKKKWWKFW